MAKLRMFKLSKMANTCRTLRHSKMSLQRTLSWSAKNLSWLAREFPWKMFKSWLTKWVSRSKTTWKCSHSMKMLSKLPITATRSLKLLPVFRTSTKWWLFPTRIICMKLQASFVISTKLCRPRMTDSPRKFCVIFCVRRKKLPVWMSSCLREMLLRPTFSKCTLLQRSSLWPTLPKVSCRAHRLECILESKVSSSHTIQWKKLKTKMELPFLWICTITNLVWNLGNSLYFHKHTKKLQEKDNSLSCARAVPIALEPLIEYHIWRWWHLWYDSEMRPPIDAFVPKDLESIALLDVVCKDVANRESLFTANVYEYQPEDLSDEDSDSHGGPSLATCFLFGTTLKGHSVSLMVRGYMPTLR